MGYNKFYETPGGSKFNSQPTKKPSDLNERVEFYKERLYDKIDIAFMQYGLSGLERIDAAIAEAFGETPAPRPAAKPVHVNCIQPQPKQCIEEEYEPIATYTEVPDDVLNTVNTSEKTNNENIDDICAAILGNIKDDDVPPAQTIPETEPVA